MTEKEVLDFITQILESATRSSDYLRRAKVNLQTLLDELKKDNVDPKLIEMINSVINNAPKFKDLINQKEENQKAYFDDIQKKIEEEEARYRNYIYRC
ncbi:MAG: hypothetical protein MJZ34_01715 [Paludibacteraceae bacterium]|nr:hypothetical protein [Paludibacteraceae bacterium]